MILNQAWAIPSEALLYTGSFQVYDADTLCCTSALVTGEGQEAPPSGLVLMIWCSILLAWVPKTHWTFSPQGDCGVYFGPVYVRPLQVPHAQWWFWLLRGDVRHFLFKRKWTSWYPKYHVITKQMMLMNSFYSHYETICKKASTYHLRDFLLLKMPTNAYLPTECFRPSLVGEPSGNISHGHLP